MQEKSALGRAMAMVRHLRSRCPWDRVQTRETLRPYLIEEAHELDQATAAGDAAGIRDEVADLLLHLAWQLVLAEELGQSEEWARLKERERRQLPRGSGVLDGLPPSLPELLMARRLQERAAAVGFDWPDTLGPAAKV